MNGTITWIHFNLVCFNKVAEVYQTWFSFFAPTTSCLYNPPVLISETPFLFSGSGLSWPFDEDADFPRCVWGASCWFVLNPWSWGSSRVSAWTLSVSLFLTFEVGRDLAWSCKQSWLKRADLLDQTKSPSSLASCCLHWQAVPGGCFNWFEKSWLCYPHFILKNFLCCLSPNDAQDG